MILDNLKKLIALQKEDGYTNYEMARILEIPENTWETWKSEIRTPKGPSLTIIRWALLALQGNPITRQQLLAKTGRIGKLTAATTKELNSEGINDQNTPNTQKNNKSYPRVVATGIQQGYY